MGLDTEYSSWLLIFIQKRLIQFILRNESLLQSKMKIIIMLLYHQTSPQRGQAIRLFQLIHESNTLNTPVVNAEATNKFLQSAGIGRNPDPVKFMHSIDKFDKQMRQQYWGSSISRALQRTKFNSEIDYMKFHYYLKQLMLDRYVPPLQFYETWDGSSQKSLSQRDHAFARIITICGQLSLYINKIDFVIFSNNIQNINHCFSLIHLFPQKKSQILQIYENILNGTFLQTLQFALSMMLSENILIQALKSLCYLYESLKIDKIRKILQNSFLVNEATLKALMQNVKDTRSQIRYYTCAMMAQMINNVKDLPVIKSLAIQMLKDNKILQEICNGIAKIREEEGLVFGIEFFIGIIRGFALLNESQKNNKLEILYVFLKFAIEKLPELKSVTNQAVCIRLVVQCVKVTDFDDKNLKLLKFASNVFEGSNQQAFAPLFEQTLNVVKFSLIYSRNNVQQTLIGDKSFENYLKKMIQNSHQQWQPYYSILQIILILAQSKNSDILFKRDLIPSIFQLSSSKNNLVRFYLSEILLCLIINSLEYEWKITYLYEKGCLNVIASLIGNFYIKDSFLQTQYKTNTPLSYCNRQTFVNALKALYFLNFENAGNSEFKRKQNYVKNFNQLFITCFYQGMINYFVHAKSRAYLTYLLKQQHSFGRNIHERQGPFLKLYKLLSTVIEQMTLHLRKRNTQFDILKLVNRTRNELHRNLYQVLTYNQLLSENIPIYLMYSVTIDGKVISQRIYRLTWAEFRSLLWEFTKRILNIQADRFKIVDKSTGQEVRNQDDYRKLIDKILFDYNRYLFTFDISLENIVQKLEQNRDMAQGSNSIRVEPNFGTRSGYAPPRSMSYRMPQARDNSPYSSRKVGGGENAPRSFSPYFASACLNCGRSTTNRSHICNNCVN